MTPMSEWARIRSGVRRARASTWDRTGGNDDSISIAPGGTATLAEDDGPGCITHIWFTLRTPELLWGRALVLRCYWDGATEPSVEVPLGDFFGAGNCISAEYASAGTSIAPRDATSFHSWLPMPYARGMRVTVTNQSDVPVPAFYCYVDHERFDAPSGDAGYLHASWNRTPPQRSATAPDPAHASNAGNHVFCDIEGEGHLIGLMLFVHNADGGWYGEGDEMILIDGEPWPPRVHGTGTEDAFGTAWGPAEAFAHPHYGQPVAQRADWAGFSHLYRWYVADPIPFTRALHASIERGHANDRADDYSSVAFWYARTPVPVPPVSSLARRIPPWPRVHLERADAVRAFFRDARPRDSDEITRLMSGLTYITAAVHRAEWARVDDALAWLAEPAAAAHPDGPHPDETLARWVSGFDAEQAGAMHVVIGFIVAGVHRQLVVEDGRARLNVADADVAEHITLVCDATTLADYTAGRLDPWEAVLRGLLRVRGDTSMAFRFGIFGTQSP